ncbi:Gfo/Idh/MocA family protein [Falsiroseomonas oryzae]|uniref:Gfo/Idh/MocA family protein n=1 Tax=Falsiroseomonas oryzae TaxID=2766473 RepID=UPI0022EA5B6E|nr:Gfo/Idh/MocA family oxidoreductase [Roseomonas sp. MO-31]
MTRRLKLGVAGLGRAFMLWLPTLAHHPRLQLVACADPRPEARARFRQDFPGSTAHGSVEALCADPEVEAVYLATPHHHHAAHAIAAARAGRHVLVEKPMAVTVAEAEAMIEAADRAGTVLMLGHSHGQDGPVRHARRLIASGQVGAPRLIHALNFTDFLWRPRRPEEFDRALGGGVVLIQASHQLDVIRVLGGGLLASIRGSAFALDAARPTDGAYTAVATFADGAAATATYSGHGRYDSDALMDWIGETGVRKPPSWPGAARGRLASMRPEEELAARIARGYGGTGQPPGLPPAAPPDFHHHFGFVLVQCEHADLRLTAEGVEIHDDSGLTLERTKLPALPRGEVVEEFCDAVLLGLPPRHDGAWGMATLEACLALTASTRDGREVRLHHQLRFRD